MSTQLASPRTYRQNAVLSASPAQLVVELYDGARRFLRQAAEAMDARQIEQTHNKLRRAELIIDHLDGVIDDSQGEISQQLHAIYAFYIKHLNEARMTLDRGKVEEVSRLLGELREAWQQVARS